MLPLPVEFKNVPQEMIDECNRIGFHISDHIMLTKPGDIMVAKNYVHLGPILYNYDYRKKDVMLLSYPKSGTTWTSEILWAMMNPDKIEMMDQMNIHGRAYFVDKDFSHPLPQSDLDRFEQVCPQGKREDGVIMQLAEKDTKPRLFWSHMPVHLHNPKMLDMCKVVYVARNPMDVAVSAYHFAKGIYLGDQAFFTGDFRDFIESYISETNPMGRDYWGHIRQGWELRNHPNFHFLFYEDLKKDIRTEMTKLMQFLKIDLTAETISKIIEATRFETMKKREEKLPIAEFLKTTMFREGKVGDAKTMFTPELKMKMAAWIKENTKGLDVGFKYE